jgi:2Fe-2S ferredoxin
VTHVVTFRLSSAAPRSFRSRHNGNLMSAALRARLPVARSCRGEAVCAACRVRVLEGAANLTPPTDGERALAARHPLREDERYACQARVVGPCTITTTYW